MKTARIIRLASIAILNTAMAAFLLTATTGCATKSATEPEENPSDDNGSGNSGSTTKKVKTLADYIAAGATITMTPSLVGTCPSTNGCGVAQGAASDGKYVYFVLRNSDDTKAVVCKYSLYPYAAISTSEIFNGGHCNDMTYHDPDNTIIVAHGQTQGKILSVLDASSLAVFDNKTITVGSGAITYDKTQKLYAISQGGSTLHIADTDLNVLRSYTRTDNTGYTAQGMGSDSSYIYFPMSGTSDNILVTYDWNGKWIMNIKVPISLESESMFCVDGKYYLCCYNGSSKGASLYLLTPSI